MDIADRFIAPRYTIHHDPADPWEGQTPDLAGFKDRARKSRTLFPHRRFAIHEMVSGPNTVLVTWFWTGTHESDLPGFPASVKSISMSGMTGPEMMAAMITSASAAEDCALSRWGADDEIGTANLITRLALFPDCQNSGA